MTQEKFLKKYFPAKTTVVMGVRLIWEGYLKPTPFSIRYKVRVVYTVGLSPRIYVIEPKKLALHPGEKKLKHVYSNRKQQLCLFYPNGREWNRSKILAYTIIPWASEWLYFHEIWVQTGQWKGGGTHPSITD